MGKVHFDFSRAKTFLSPYPYISWLSTLLHIFLSNFRQTYFSLLTKIFMMNSNYSVVAVSWDLSCGPMCTPSSSVWMHNKETVWVFIYVWCSLPYPQTLTWRSLNKGMLNTKMWIESLVQDVPGVQTAKAWYELMSAALCHPGFPGYPLLSLLKNGTQSKFSSTLSKSDFPACVMLGKSVWNITGVVANRSQSCTRIANGWFFLKNSYCVALFFS